jgi:hypothetical protein
LGLIEQEEAAKRLARVIVSDIELYNRDKIRSRANLEPELREGYTLFRSRVIPALVPIFSQVVADRLGTGAKPAVERPRPIGAAPPPVPPPSSHSPAPSSHSAPPARRDPLEPLDAARRLARVMVSSIPGSDRDDGGAGLTEDIEEARAMFRSCVLPELAPLFEEALAKRGLLAQVPVPFNGRPTPVRPVELAQASAPDAVVAGEATDRVMMSGAMAVEGTTEVDGLEDDLPTLARPVPPAPQPDLRPQRTLSGARLAAVVIIAAATAGIVYLLLAS